MHIILKILLESILPVLLLLPLIMIFTKDENQIKTIGFFLFIFICYQLILKIPIEYKELQFINGKRNWTGKLIGIFFGSVTYLLIYKKLQPFTFLRIKQDPNKLAKTILICSILIFTAFFSCFDSAKEFDTEILIFQLTMPGLDEEIMFRGILLALLLTCLKDKIKIGKRTFGNPCILIIGLLFGLVHGCSVSNKLELNFEFYPFIWTFIFGYIWSWVTVESKSILLPILSHNLTNFIQNLVRMV
ncbi:CPBP family intramembrane glutamic endopeptidase [Pseudomonas shirazensis]